MPFPAFLACTHPKMLSVDENLWRFSARQPVLKLSAEPSVKCHILAYHFQAHVVEDLAARMPRKDEIAYAVGRHQPSRSFHPLSSNANLYLLQRLALFFKTTHSGHSRHVQHHGMAASLFLPVLRIVTRVKNCTSERRSYRSMPSAVYPLLFLDYHILTIPPSNLKEFG